MSSQIDTNNTVSNVTFTAIIPSADGYGQQATVTALWNSHPLPSATLDQQHSSQPMNGSGVQIELSWSPPVGRANGTISAIGSTPDGPLDGGDPVFEWTAEGQWVVPTP